MAICILRGGCTPQIIYLIMFALSSNGRSTNRKHNYLINSSNSNSKTVRIVDYNLRFQM